MQIVTWARDMLHKLNAIIKQNYSTAFSQLLWPKPQCHFLLLPLHHTHSWCMTKSYGQEFQHISNSTTSQGPRWHECVQPTVPSYLHHCDSLLPDWSPESALALFQSMLHMAATVVLLRQKSDPSLLCSNTFNGYPSDLKIKIKLMSMTTVSVPNILTQFLVIYFSKATLATTLFLRHIRHSPTLGTRIHYTLSEMLLHPRYPHGQLSTFISSSLKLPSQGGFL